MKSVLYDYTPEELQEMLDTSNGYCDLLRKVGLNGHGRNPETLKKLINEYGLDTTQNSLNRSNLYRSNAAKTHLRTKINTQDILDGNHPNYTSSALLKRLVNEGYKEYVCEICGINEHNNFPITLQLHHIDGNRQNNNLSNLQILCPNCHSQTDNFAGKLSRKTFREKCVSQEVKRKPALGKLRNVRRSMIPPVNRDELKSKIRSLPFTTIADMFGVTDNAIRKWCKKFALPFKKSEIKTISDAKWEII